MFSLSQRLKFYQPMVDQAWKAHCDQECITDSTAASKKDWERLELKRCFGTDTTKDLNKGKDFDKAMAHFEELAGDGIYWQMKLLKGDAARAQYQLNQTINLLRLDLRYVAGIAEQMGISGAVASWNAEQTIRVRTAVLYHIRRKQNKAIEEKPA